MSRIGLGKLPEPPAGTPAEEAAVWRATVRGFPSDWFRESDFPLLLELARAVVMADKLAKRIAKTKDVSKLSMLLTLRDREARRAATMATKLRIAPQSRSDRHVAGVAAKNHGPRPWERDAAADEFLGTTQ